MLHFFHIHQNLLSTFGAIAKYFMFHLMKFDGYEIHFVSDKWVTPSIKDIERNSGGCTSFSYQITGPSQQRSSNWVAALNSGTKIPKSAVSN